MPRWEESSGKLDELIPTIHYRKLKVNRTMQVPGRSSFTGLRLALHVKHRDGAHILLPSVPLSLGHGSEERPPSTPPWPMIAFSVKKPLQRLGNRVAGASIVLTDETDPELPRGQLVSGDHRLRPRAKQ